MTDYDFRSNDDDYDFGFMSVSDVIASITEKQNAAIERELEAALVTGVDGVVVIREGTTLYTGHTPEVPYGTIYNFPSFEAYYKWLGRDE